MSLTKQIPAWATLGNAAAGFAACALVVAGRPELAALMVLVAVLLDSLDGALARSLDAVSEFGGQLDSLADVISFGVAPAVLAGSLLPPGGGPLAWGLVALYPLCATWRLARYNVFHATHADDESEFSGLPSTGAGAGAVTAIVLDLRLLEGHALLGASFLPTLMALLGLLMVSRVPYKHAGAIISRLRPAVAILFGAAFVAGTLLWHYEILFFALMWSYVLYAPLLAAGQKILALRQA
ncbi:MAG: CDP-alcohol phosphatidyltransferase family protein [Candidatus Brocadiia bacterium]